MSATFAPFGLRPVYHPSGYARPQAFAEPFSSNYAVNLYQGTPVTMNTSGNLVVAANGTGIIGVFDGVEYTDANGRRQYSKRWVASTTTSGAAIVAYVWAEPTTIFEIQTNGSLAQTSIGDQMNFSAAAGFAVGDGSTTTQLSTMGGDPTLVGVGVQGMLRVLDVSPYVDNAWGDAFTIARVNIARHEYVANIVAV